MNKFEEQYTNAIEDWLTAIESHDITRFINAAKRLQRYDEEHHNEVLTYIEDVLRPCISENEFDYILDSLIWMRWNHLYSFASDISFIQRCRTRFDEDTFDAEFERLVRLYETYYCIERRERWNVLKNEANWNVIVANPGFFGEGLVTEFHLDKYGNITMDTYPDPEYNKDNDQNDQNK